MRFKDLNEAQLLAVAITAEEEDGHIYRDFAEKLRRDFPATADLFIRMSQEESTHRHRLIDLYRQRFGEHIPLIRRQDVKGFWVPPSWWLVDVIQPEKAREQAALMELEARRFYEAAAAKSSDAAVRQLLGDLAQEEIQHEKLASDITEAHERSGVLAGEKHV
ncbi:MAG: ferritin family protein, partial [Candidatus Omnitrophica bacterium]|nr:ferritin family protein [Candidatus Omnitrophota bacterium]